MDECEELCNRLAIMASGKFKCIGYIPKLKELFGNGFTLLIKVREKCQFEKVAEIKSAIGEMFICQLRDDYAVCNIVYNYKSIKYLYIPFLYRVL